MAVTVDSFRLNYPEFSETDRGLISRKLDAARLRISSTAFGDNVDQGVMLLTAHLLSISPDGEKARLEGNPAVTLYSTELDTMRRVAAMGIARTS